MVSKFYISPLIRLPLLTLYLTLTVPLPILAQATPAPVAPAWLWGAVGLGAILLWGTLSEQVITDNQGITVTYPLWVFWYRARGWSLSWSEIHSLKPRTTSQGGLVYYFLSHSGAAYLLPMRIAGFAQLLRQVQAKTQIDTTNVRPLAQPWMYLLLFAFTLLLLGMETWTLLTLPEV